MYNVVASCYLSSLLFYGIGYWKTLVIKNAVTLHLNVYDYTNSISIATGYFVLAILFALMGSLIFYVKRIQESEITDIEWGAQRETQSSKF